MSKHDDFLDDYIGYRIFEDSMKGSGGGKTPRKNTGCGCGTWAVLICIVIFLLGVFGSCSKSSPSRYSSSYHSYGTSYSTHSKSSYSSSSKSNSSASSGSKHASSNTSKSLSSSKYKSSSSTKKSSDPYDAKSYAHPDDIIMTTVMTSGTMRMRMTITTSIRMIDSKQNPAIIVLIET